MAYIVANKAVFIGLLLAVSEVLSLSPKIKANGIFQLVINLIKKA